MLKEPKDYTHETETRGEFRYTGVLDDNAIKQISTEVHALCNKTAAEGKLEAPENIKFSIDFMEVSHCYETPYHIIRYSFRAAPKNNF